MPSSRPVETRAPASVREVEVRLRMTDAERKATHKARVRASLEWALDEYADTLEELSK